MQTTHPHLGSILEGRTDPSSDMVARLAAYLQRSPDDVKVWLRESDWGENLPGASNHLSQEFRDHVSLIATYLTIVWLLSAQAARTWDSLQTVRLPAIQDPRTGQTTTVEDPAGLYDYVQKQLAKMSNEQVFHVLEAAGALARIAFTDSEFLQHFREFHEALHPMLPQTQGKLRRDPAADHPESKRKTYFDYLSEDEKDLIRTLIRKLAAHKIEADSE
ncbi:MAG: hypothetical protein M1318_07655 [Firmicutes bacterium]|nr:hypothetical protein [Bacillota bacterium]